MSGRDLEEPDILEDNIDSKSNMSGKQANWPYVFNLGNSIIGVSVLAMPFCFKQCGVLLGMLLLLSSAWLTYTSCNLLIKGAFTTRRRSYEYLAFHTFGPAGKLAVEVSIIGLLIGTCVAFFVIIGDLGPAIVSKMIGVENSSNLRMFLMMFLALFVALPLGMLRNIESLSNVSAISLGFYSVFVAEIITLAFPHLWSGVWVTRVVYWNLQGVFKCLPIFSVAFACQSQLFVMYDALPDPSVKRMKYITKSAIGMCTAVYLLVGYFGYVAFCDEEVMGDILMNFRSTIFSEAVKLGFVLSVAVSFPLAIFPCRASIYTLLFAKEKGHHDSNFMGPIYIPDVHFRFITIAIVMGTLTVGILVPNVEFVLALTGATMGSMICYIFPAVMFISIMSMTKSNNKSMAQVVLFLGVTILLASTYVTLNTQDKVGQVSGGQGQQQQAGETDLDLDNLVARNVFRPPKFAVDHSKPHVPDDVVKKEEKEATKKEEVKESDKGVDKDNKDEELDKRQEPPNPHAPLEEDKEEDKPKSKENNTDGEKKEEVKKEEKELVVKISTISPSVDKKNENGLKDAKEVKELLVEMKKQQAKQEEMIAQQREIIEELKQHKEEHINEQQVNQKPVQGQQAQQQPAGDQQVQQQNAGGQPPVQQQPAGGQPPVQQQPVGGQPPVQQQPFGGQSPVQQQPVGGQPPVQQQPAGGQQPVQQQQPAGGQPPVQQQPAGGQQPVQQQPAGGQQPVQQLPAGGQQPVQQQLAGGQQPVQQQPAGGQPMQPQLVGGQQPLQQQPAGGQLVQQQQAGGQVPLQQQPSGGQQVPQIPAGGQQLQQQPAAGQQQFAQGLQAGGGQPLVQQPAGGQSVQQHLPIGGVQQQNINTQAPLNKQLADQVQTKIPNDSAMDKKVEKAVKFMQDMNIVADKIDDQIQNNDAAQEQNNQLTSKNSKKVSKT